MWHTIRCFCAETFCILVIPRFYLFVFSKSCVCIYVIISDLAKQDCHNFSFPLFQSYFKVIFQCCKNSKSFCILSPKIIKMLEHFGLSLGGLSLRIFRAKVVLGTFRQILWRQSSSSVTSSARSYALPFGEYSRHLICLMMPLVHTLVLA